MKTKIQNHLINYKKVIYAVAILFGLLFVFLASRAVAIDSPTGSKEYLITVYDRGIETLILTDTDTIGEALAEAGIELDDKDAVEPSRQEQLIASEYNVNIYRARPVTVVDGVTRQKVITPYQTAEQIAKSAGIELYLEDVSDISLTSNILSDGAGLLMTIDRATEFSLDLYGKTSIARSQGETVGDMLESKSIVLEASDKVSPSSSTELVLGMDVRVWREGKHTVTVTEEVQFGVATIYDGDRPIGYRAITVPGVLGSRNVTYDVSVENGEEISRIEIASLVTKQPIKQIEVAGVNYDGELTSASQNESITWAFLLSQGFTRNQTAGIMGNLMQEHRFNTGDTASGLGIAQWIGGRRLALMGIQDYTNIYVQLDYLMYELNGSEKNAYNAILGTSSVADAVRAFQNKFERCGICLEDQRISYAYQILGRH